MSLLAYMYFKFNLNRLWCNQGNNPEGNLEAKSSTLQSRLIDEFMNLALFFLAVVC